MKTKLQIQEEFITEEYRYFHPFYKNGTYPKPVLLNNEYFDGIIFKNLLDQKYYLRRIFPEKPDQIFAQVELNILSDLFERSEDIITSLEPNSDCDPQLIKKVILG